MRPASVLVGCSSARGRPVANMLRSPMLAAHGRRMSGLPYRIRAPLAKLVQRKNNPQGVATSGGLGDGEKLETNATGPDYVRLALTSRVYDVLSETPCVPASCLVPHRFSMMPRPLSPTSDERAGVAISPSAGCSMPPD